METREHDDKCRTELEMTIAMLRIERDRALNDAAELRACVRELRRMIRTKFADIEHAVEVTLKLPGEE